MREFCRRHTNGVAYALGFSIPVLVMTAVFAFDGIAPFGPLTIFNSDLANLYVSYLAHYRDMVLGGLGVFWSWNIGMGYNMYSYFVDNTSSPLNLLLLLFPENCLSEAVLCIQLIRIGLMGLAATWFIRKHGSTARDAVLLGCAYALSGYTVCYLQHVMWMDSLILLPVVVYATEHMAASRKVIDLPLVGALVAVFWCSFYLGYMTALFLALYTIWFTVVELEGDFKRVFINLCRLAVGGFFTFLILGFALFPIIFAKLGSGGFVEQMPLWYFNVADITYPLYFGTFDEYEPGCRPMLYCGLFVVFLVGVYFANKRIARKERITSGIIVAVLMLSMIVAPVYYAWHMFDQPDWFEGRFTFCTIFFLLVLASRELMHKEGTTRRHILLCAGVLLAVFIADTVWFNAQEPGKSYEIALGALTIRGSVHQLLWPLVLVNIAGILAYAGCAMPLFSKDERLRQGFSRFLRIACMVELVASSFALNQFVYNAEPYSNASNFEGMRSAVSATLDDLGVAQTDALRVEKTFSYRDNDSLLDGYNGIAMFGSDYDIAVHQTLGSLGINSGYKFTRYIGSTPVTDSLLGIRYVMTSYENATMPYNGICLDSDYQATLYPIAASSHGVVANQNPYALPLMFAADKALASVDIASGLNPFELQDAIVNAAFTGSRPCFTALQDVHVECTNVHVQQNADGTWKLTAAGDATQPRWVDFIVNDTPDSLVFAYVAQAGDSSGTYDAQFFNTRSFDVPKNILYDTYSSPRIIQLNNGGGSYALRVVLKNDSALITNPLIYRFDAAALESATAAVRQQGNPITTFFSTRVEATVTADANQMVFASLPSADGWTVTVNGQPAAIEHVLGGLTGISVPEGQSAIVLTYAPPGWDTGVLLTAAGIILLAGCKALGVALSRRREQQR